MIPKEITEDLRSGMGLEECLIKHNTNLKSLLSKSSLGRQHDEENKYIERRRDKFYIKKSIGSKTLFFGIYSSLKDAQLVRDRLILTGWKQNQVDKICKQLRVTRVPGKNEQRYYEK